MNDSLALLEPIGIPVLISAVSVPSRRLDFVIFSQIKFLLIVKPGVLPFKSLCKWL